MSFDLPDKACTVGLSHSSNLVHLAERTLDQGMVGSLLPPAPTAPTLPSAALTAETVEQIKVVAYSVVAYVIVGVGLLGNLLSLVVLTRPNLKGVMYVYLLGLAVSNLCVLVTAVPALADMGNEGGTGGAYSTAFYQVGAKYSTLEPKLKLSCLILQSERSFQKSRDPDF